MGHALSAARRPAILSLLALTSCTGARATARPAPTTPALTSSAIRAHVELLASDALLGRQTPSAGVDVAAAYVAQQLEGAGLAGGAGGGFVQRFPFPLVAPDGERARLVVVADGERRVLAPGVDYAMLAGGKGEGASGTARLVGALPALLSSRALDTMRLDGIVAMRLPGYPGDVARRLAAGARDAAARRGARGVLFLVDGALPPGVMRQAARAADSAARIVGDASAGIPAAFVRDARTVAALAGSEPPRVELAAPLRVVQADSAPNVVAVLRGRDPALADEYVVVSAHLDHVGERRGLADSVFNGADDNASGTAALIEIARALAALPTAERPRRSVLFLAVSGEEHGLLGSRWFVEHPTVPLARIVANVNLDMIGRNAPDRVIGIGMELSTLGDDARAAAAAGAHGLALEPDPQPGERHFLRSDQYSFARVGVPAIMLSTGPHADYHLVSDEVERLDTEKAARVGHLALALVRRVADAATRPRWTEAGEAMLREVRR